MGSSNENSAFGPGAQPVGPRRACPAARRAAAPPRSPPGWRRGRSAPTPAARSASRPRCAGSSGSSPPTARCSRYGMIAFASSLDQAGPADPRRHRRARCCSRTWSATTRCDSTSLRVPGARSSCRRAEDLRGHPPRRPRGAHRRRGRDRAGRARELRGDAEARRGARRDDRDLPAAARAARAVGLLPDRPGRGVGQPRALRRRALRAARRRRRRPARRCTARTRHDGLRRRGQAPDHARHLRAVQRLLRRLLRDARRRCARRSPRTSTTAFERFDFVVTPTSPWTAFELGAKTDDPLAMYLNDFCTVPMSLAGIPAISIPSGLSERPAGRLPARRPGVQREPASSTPRYALEQAIGFDGSAARR